jgi:hypothetical protein
VYYERLIYDILKEEDFKARSTETGRIVRFGSKEAMKAAIKKGSHAPLEKKKGKSGDVFAKDKPKEKPQMPGHRSRGMGTAVTDKYKEGDIVDAKIAIGDLSDGLSNGGKKIELNDLYGKMDQANRGMADDEDWEAMARDLSPEVKQEIQDYADIHSDGAEVLKPVLDAMEEPEGGFGGDTGTDADFQGEPPEGAREPEDPDSEFGKDYTRKFMGTDEPDDDDWDTSYPNKESADMIETGIDDTIASIPDDASRMDAYTIVMDTLSDEEDYKDMVDRVEQLQEPDEPEEKLAYWVVAGALERGELEPNAGHMELANFAATYEEDFYERVMDESPYAANDMGESTKPWKSQYNRLFESLHRI